MLIYLMQILLLGPLVCNLLCNLLCAVQFLRPRLRLVLDREELEIIPVQISSVVMHGFSLDL